MMLYQLLVLFLFASAHGQNEEEWIQGCAEDVPSGHPMAHPPHVQCGTREFDDNRWGKPDYRQGNREFPWTVAMISQRKDSNIPGHLMNGEEFVGNGVLVPDTQNNDVSQGTGKVISYGEVFKLDKQDTIEARVYEYNRHDSEHNVQESQELRKHKDFEMHTFPTEGCFKPDNVSCKMQDAEFHKHMLMVAVTEPDPDTQTLKLDKKVYQKWARPLRPGELRRGETQWFPAANAACLPACPNMFSHKFSNGTGVRCWVAGWEFDKEDVQRKKDVPLVDRETCQQKLNEAGIDYQLSPEEFCAGGEEGQEDVCKFNKGAGLVCLSKEQHWHVVGVGVGCMPQQGHVSELLKIPHIYLDVHYLKKQVLKVGTFGTPETSSPPPPTTTTNKPTINHPECTVIAEATNETAQCVFPFVYKEQKFYGCTTLDDADDRHWCSIKTDENDVHFVNQGLWGYCNEIIGGAKSPCRTNEAWVPQNSDAFYIETAILRPLKEDSDSKAADSCPCKSIVECPWVQDLNSKLAFLTSSHPVKAQVQEFFIDRFCQNGEVRCCD